MRPPARFPSGGLRSENRSTGYRSKGFQRLALAGNDRLERVFRRHPEMKRTLRTLYYRVNGRTIDETIPEHVRAELSARYEEPNARLAELLDTAGVARPGWLASGSPNRSGVNEGE